MTERLVDRIRSLVQPVFDEEKIYLVDLELRGSSGSQVLKMFADTKDGITLKQITRLTRQINDLLDISEIVEGTYRLEVSSPGIDRPLTQLWEFEKNIGRKLRVITEVDAEEQVFDGTLIAVADDEIKLKDKKKKEITIPWGDVIKARVQLKW